MSLRKECTLYLREGLEGLHIPVSWAPRDARAATRNPSKPLVRQHVDLKSCLSQGVAFMYKSMLCTAGCKASERNLELAIATNSNFNDCLHCFTKKETKGDEEDAMQYATKTCTR